MFHDYVTGLAAAYLLDTTLPRTGAPMTRLNQESRPGEMWEKFFFCCKLVEQFGDIFGFVGIL